MRYCFIGLLILTALFTAAPAPALDPVYQEPAGLAIKGYDPVAYFTRSKPVKGSTAHTHEWMGAVWRFSSPEHRDAFIQNPEKYAPRYGGYCAWAIGQGYIAPIDPAAWSIYKDQLYLNYNQGIRRRWERDKDGHIRLADKNWPTLKK